VLLVGAGGREHALAWRLAGGAGVELHAAPGNPGIARHGVCHPVRADDVEGLLALARDVTPDLVVVGPEAPLVAGLADEIRAAGTPVFGPSAAAARIEGSKAFAKDVLRASGVPAARELDAPRAPCVVKADGLAAGKGVFVCHTDNELEAGLRAARAFGARIVVEELLEGEEVSVFALCDGRSAVGLPVAQDFKRIGDGDSGPNTGGMGSYAPVPGWGPAEVEDLLDAVHRPVLRELAARGAPFVGTLFAGLMLTDDGPRVLEFNCRFGDPETQSLVPLLDGDLGAVLAAAAAGDVGGAAVDIADGAAVTVVIAAGTYPERGDTGSTIHGLDEAEAAGALVFHAGTAVHDRDVVTNGGRVLNVTAVGDTVADARARAYDAVDLVSFAGARYRTDIAARAEHVLR
jgi:phosphoribosylamine--glycine ligase